MHVSDCDNSVVALLKRALAGVVDDDAICTFDILHRSSWHRLFGIATITAGFPCQPHSTIGLRLGLDDPRDLFLALLDLLAFVRPVRMLLENVMGFFNSNLVEVAKAFATAVGYQASVHIANCEHFLPQKRKRGCLTFTRVGIPLPLAPSLPPLPPPTIANRAVLQIENFALARAELSQLLATAADIELYSPFQPDSRWPPGLSRIIELSMQAPCLVTSIGFAAHRFSPPWQGFFFGT